MWNPARIPWLGSLFKGCQETSIDRQNCKQFLGTSVLRLSSFTKKPPFLGSTQSTYQTCCNHNRHVSLPLSIAADLSVRPIDTAMRSRWAMNLKKTCSPFRWLVRNTVLLKLLCLYKMFLQQRCPKSARHMVSPDPSSEKIQLRYIIQFPNRDLIPYIHYILCPQTTK